MEVFFCATWDLTSRTRRAKLLASRGRPAELAPARPTTHQPARRLGGECRGPRVGRSRCCVRPLPAAPRRDRVARSPPTRPRLAPPHPRKPGVCAPARLRVWLRVRPCQTRPDVPAPGRGAFCFLPRPAVICSERDARPLPHPARRPRRVGCFLLPAVGIPLLPAPAPSGRVHGGRLFISCPRRHTDAPAPSFRHGATMTDLHTMSVEAQQQIQELLVKLPAHFRADVLLQLDRGSIYRRVLQGWDGYFLANPKLRPTVFRLAHHLLATGEVSRTGCVVVPHPGQRSDIAKALGVKERAAYDAATWLAECPLGPTHTPTYPTTSDCSDELKTCPRATHKGGFNSTTPGSMKAFPAASTPPGPTPHPARTRRVSGAIAPGAARSRRMRGGAIAPGATTPSGAFAPDSPLHPPDSGAIAPCLLNRSSSSSRFNSPAAASGKGKPARTRRVPDWLPAPNLDRPEPRHARAARRPGPLRRAAVRPGPLLGADAGDRPGSRPGLPRPGQGGGGADAAALQPRREVATANLASAGRRLNVPAGSRRHARAAGGG